ncbi:hypothetical protein DDB_G0278193 [Dictyostelium discoideum AX4]|uniref:Glutamine amidotransferase type-2 domain-containing protein n=1 Tax=Dictyostelium discoideum TaxID=44689 RepID=Q54YK5_DICDI|nr:hypothetical protein DDB_G0278193 [Dictyostelium discoideum AX4]EAL68269.1 hypothetical protein DDB_G0278193 [Dictyostelium discoideum AX4]|eukprot:XP_642197.1 hypothetical protein DDB_G0278193 [Dictyostelium discoideum AX4]
MCGISVIINGIKILEPINKNGQNKDLKETITTSTSTPTPIAIGDYYTIKNDIESRLINRGPDSIKSKLIEIKCFQKDIDKEISISMELISSVLGLRGPLTIQPLTDENNGNTLLWNGELFGGYEIGIHDNDTCLLLHLLSKINENESENQEINENEIERELIEIMLKIKGPFAFLYWQEKKRKLWFGRDVLGRRSLLVNNETIINDKPSLIISSMGSFPNGIDDSIRLPKWDEINTFGLFSIHFPKIIETNIIHFKIHPWDISNINLNIGMISLDYDNDNDNEEESNTNTTTTTTTTTTKEIEEIEGNNIDQLHFYPFGRREKLDIEKGEWSEKVFNDYVNGFYEAISDSINVRLNNLPIASLEIPDLIRAPFLQEKPLPLVSRLGILFSGGLDSMVLAAMSNKHMETPDEPIHLINVAFGDDDSPFEEYDKVPDRKAAISGLKELQTIAPNRQWKLIKVNVGTKEMEWAKKIVYQLSYPAITIMDMTICLALWFAGRGEGILHGEELKGQGQQQQQRYMTTFVYPRFPYLDESLISYLNGIELPYICDLSLPQGTGDKRILREVGPIQFGSRSSKQLNKNVPARITQKCGKDVFSFTTPIYDPLQDPGYEALQKQKLKQKMSLERKEKKNKEKSEKIEKKINFKNQQEKQKQQPNDDENILRKKEVKNCN